MRLFLGILGMCEVIVVVVLYLLLAFGTMQLNPVEWEVAVRIIGVAVFVIVQPLVGLSVIWATILIEDNRD